jgi:hypothetical protein
VRDTRTIALGHLVGQSRAYLQQLDMAKAELEELKAPDLSTVLQAIDGAVTSVQALNLTATEKLRARR